jgi:hypothetical protein
LHFGFKFALWPAGLLPAGLSLPGFAARTVHFGFEFALWPAGLLPAGLSLPGSAARTVHFCFKFALWPTGLLPAVENLTNKSRYFDLVYFFLVCLALFCQDGRRGRFFLDLRQNFLLVMVTFA